MTIWIKDSDWLMILAAGMIIITTIPSFFSYWESPEYLFKKGYITELFSTLREIGEFNGNFIEEDFFMKQLIDTEYLPVLEGRNIRIKEIKSGD